MADHKRSDLLNDVRFLRDVVAKAQPPAVNHYWPVTLSWGIVTSIGYVVCAILAMNGRIDVLPWVWPVLIVCVALPLHWFLGRRVRSKIQERGIRPRFRKDLALCWISITVMGLLWTAAMAISGLMATHWYVLSFLWGSLYFVGYVMNGVLLSSEWFGAAVLMLASLVVAYLAGPNYYWLPGIWIGGTMLVAGLAGRQNAHRHFART